MPDKRSYCLYIAFFIFFWLLVSPAATAAPFCVEQQGIPSECWFYDVNSCRHEAGRRGGHCSVNLEEVTLPEQGAPFCVMDSGMVPVCSFQSGESCNEAAAKGNAVCFQNASSESYDPFRMDRPLFRHKN